MKKKRLQHYIRKLIFTLIIAALIMTGYNLFLQRNMPTGQAPDIQATLINGESIDLQALSTDQPVLVYFWGSWCSICTIVSPAINEIAQDYRVVTIALTSGSDQRIKAYLKANNLDFAVVNDKKGHFSQHWKVSITPSIFIIQNGEIRSITTGYTSKLGLQFRLWWYGSM